MNHSIYFESTNFTNIYTQRLMGKVKFALDPEDAKDVSKNRGEIETLPCLTPAGVTYKWER